LYFNQFLTLFKQMKIRTLRNKRNFDVTSNYQLYVVTSLKFGHTTTFNCSLNKLTHYCRFKII